MGGRRALVAVALGLAALAELVHPASARAQVNAERSRVRLALDYAVPGNCPTASEFRASVEGRTALADFVEETKGVEVVEVRVRATGSAYAGHLFMAPLEGAMSTRDVQDLHCADVVDALALVTALAIDPNAALSPPPSAPAPPPPPSQAAPLMPAHIEPTVVTLVDTLPPRPMPVTPRVRLLFAPPGDEPDAPAPRAPLVWRANTGADGEVLGGVAPDVMLGGGAFAELASDGRGVFVPSGRVSLLAAANGAFEARTASFTLLDARLMGCPLRFGNKRFSISPCGAVDVGALLVEGVQVARPVSAIAPWLAVDLLARMRWQPWERRGIFLEAAGGIELPLNRPTYTYDLSSTDTQDVFHSPAYAPIASVGGGLRFR